MYILYACVLFINLRFPTAPDCGEPMTTGCTRMVSSVSSALCEEGLRWGVDARKKVGDLITRKSGVRWIYQADVLEILYVLFSLGYSQYMSNWRFNFSHQELGWLKINIFLGIEWDVYIYIYIRILTNNMIWVSPFVKWVDSQKNQDMIISWHVKPREDLDDTF